MDEKLQQLIDKLHLFEYAVDLPDGAVVIFDEHANPAYKVIPILKEEPRYYTTQEAAKMLKVTVRTIFRWIDSGKLKTKRVARKHMISEEAIQEAFEE